VKRLAVLFCLVSLGFWVIEVSGATRYRNYRRLPPRAPGYDGPMRPPVRRNEQPLERPEFLAEPNAVVAGVKQFEGLGKSIDKVTSRGQSESRQWVQGPAEMRLRLLRSVYEQVVEEFGLLRSLAAEEGAKKTIAALDALMLERYDRYNRVLQRMESQMRRYRQGPYSGLRDRGYREGSRYNGRDRYGPSGGYGGRGGYQQRPGYDQRGGPDREYDSLGIERYDQPGRSGRISTRRYGEEPARRAEPNRPSSETRR